MTPKQALTHIARQHDRGEPVDVSPGTFHRIWEANGRRSPFAYGVDRYGLWLNLQLFTALYGSPPEGHPRRFFRWQRNVYTVTIEAYLMTAQMLDSLVEAGADYDELPDITALLVEAFPADHLPPPAPVGPIEPVERRKKEKPRKRRLKRERSKS